MRDLDKIAYDIYISFFDKYKKDGVFPDDFGVSPGILDIDNFIKESFNKNSYYKTIFYYKEALIRLRKEKLKKLLKK